MTLLLLREGYGPITRELLITKEAERKVEKGYPLKKCGVIAGYSETCTSS